MDSAFAASSFGASGSRIGTSRTPVSGPGVRKSEDKTEETGGSIYEQLYASGVRSMGDAYFMGGSAAANQAKTYWNGAEATPRRCGADLPPERRRPFLRSSLSISC